MGKVIAFASNKGKSGKTTSVINIADNLSLKKKKVLVIDTTYDSSLTNFYLDNVPSTTLEDVLLNGTDVNSAIVKGSVDLLPSNGSMEKLEDSLYKTNDRESALKRVIDTIKDNYDFILIDCPNTISGMTINSLVSADDVIIPTPCNYSGISDIGKLLNTIRIIQNRLNINLEINCFLLTNVDVTNHNSKTAKDEMNTHFSDMVNTTEIVKSTKVKKAFNNKKTLNQLSKRLNVSKCYKEFTNKLV